MSRTHDLAEWASVLSLAVGVHASYSVLWFVFVDASRKDFVPLLQAAVDAWWALNGAVASVEQLARDAVVYARLSLREAAITAAALAALLIPTSPERAA